MDHSTIHAIIATWALNESYVNHSFANITPFDAHIHVEEVEKTLRDPSLINQVPYTFSSTVSLNSRSTYAALVNTLEGAPRNAYLLARVVLARLAVEAEESAQVELGGLEELDLADVDLNVLLEQDSSANLRPENTYVTEGVDALGGLLDLTAHNLRDELGGELATPAPASQ